MAFSDRSRPALQAGPGPGGQSGSCPGNSREAAPGSSPGRMRDSGGDSWVSSVHTVSSSLPNEEPGPEGMGGTQPHYGPDASFHGDSGPPHSSPWAGRHRRGTGKGRDVPGTHNEVGQHWGQNVGPIISTASQGLLSRTLWGECFLTVTLGLPAPFQGYFSPSRSEHNFCAFKFSTHLLS